MKKFYLFSFLFCVFVFSSNAQYTMLHQFDTGADFVSPFDAKSQTKYYHVAFEDQTIYFYYQDFTFHKSVTAPVIEGYEIYMNGSFEFVSDEIFNSDTLIEFTCDYLKEGTSTTRVYVFNENLDEVAVFDSASIQRIYQTIDGEIRMDLRKYDWSPTPVNTQTWLLRESPTSVNIPSEKSKLLPFPNPSSSAVNLPYELESGETSVMKIIDMNGKLIQTLKIGSHFNQILLNTSGLQPGMYIYSYKNKSGKFLVK